MDEITYYVDGYALDELAQGAFNEVSTSVYAAPGEGRVELARRTTIQPTAGQGEQYRAAIATVCEGWTLPADARKVLETALWAAPVAPADAVRDAERYRWLRDKSEPGICAFYLSVGQAFKNVKFARETVDEAIDAQIEALRHTTPKEPAK